MKTLHGFLTVHQPGWNILVSKYLGFGAGTSTSSSGSGGLVDAFFGVVPDTTHIRVEGAKE